VSVIHPTAVVSPNAEVGSDCKIGPYCVIGEDVTLGEDCRLHSHVVIEGPTRIGPGNRFFPFSSIGQVTQDLKYKGEPTYLEIGGQNTFREYVTINRGTGIDEKTVVGNHNTILAYSHIAHNCVVGNHVIMSNGATLAGHVTVEDRAVIGGLAAIHQFCRIGRLAIVGGCSKVVQDVPPFMLADGNPAEVRTINKVGLERNGIGEEIQESLKKAYKYLYRTSTYNIQDALAKILHDAGQSEEIKHLVQFVVQSERGISR
jgi:UDP-N-acetylglucosamine acyltransferase